MFTSRLAANGRPFGHPERAHSLVVSGLGVVKHDDDRRGYLFRILDDGDKAIVRTIERPDWAALESDGVTAVVKETSFDGIEDGEVLEFNLMANPTEKDPSGKEHPVRTTGGQVEWIEKIAKERGFLVQEVDVKKLEPVEIPKDTGPRTLQPVLFRGVLSVKDANSFRKCLLKGIGRSKCYGYGMLIVTRPI